MLKLFLFATCFFLIAIIFVRIPQESTGLSSFATKSNLLGSPASAQKSLNFLTTLAILLFFIETIVGNIKNI